MSSAGLRVILRGAKLLEGHHGELAICNAGDRVRRFSVTSGFNSLIKIYDTEKGEAFLRFLVELSCLNQVLLEPACRNQDVDEAADRGG